ncbi:MAG: porin [Sutterella wadsworthensis]
MKHSILCCAVTGALASGAAFAADTQIYGVIDTGFSVRNNQYVNGNSDTTTRMVSGQYIGSRFGIKGSEDLGNGYKAGFVLESSIKTDDGSLGQGGRLWGREARVYLSGDFGEVSFGRVGPIVGGNGPVRPLRPRHERILLRLGRRRRQPSGRLARLRIRRQRRHLPYAQVRRP